MSTRKTPAPKAKSSPPNKSAPAPKAPPAPPTKAKQISAPKVASGNPVPSPKLGTAGLPSTSKTAPKKGDKQKPDADNRFRLGKDADIREQPHGAALDTARKDDVFTVYGLARRPEPKAEIYAEVHFGSHRRYIVAAAFVRHEEMLRQFGSPKIVDEKTKVTLAKWRVRADLGHDAIIRKHPDDKAQKVDSFKPGHQLGVERLNGKNVNERNGWVWVSKVDHMVNGTFDHTGWIRKSEIEPQP